MNFPAAGMSARMAAPWVLVPVWVSAFVGMALISATIVAVPAAAVEDVTTARLEGPERNATAAAIAGEAFPDGTNSAILATSQQAADALTASALAGATDSAMLLLNPDDVPAVTAAALTDLEVQSITIVGSPATISEGVQTTLEADYEVQRIFGEDQYSTAVAVAEETIAQSELPVIDGLRTVILASGEDFPDALAGSAAAVAGPVPVLYAQQDDLTQNTRDFFAGQDVEQVVILGGPVAVGTSVAEELESDDVAVVRLGGANRVETAAIVAEWTTATFTFSEDTLLLARADEFPDALTAGQLAGRYGRPLVLSATPTVLPGIAEQYFADRCETIEVVQAIGGVNAVSQDVLTTAETAAETCTVGGGTPGGGDYTAQPAELDTEAGRVDSIVFTGLGSTTQFDAVMLPCAAVSTTSAGTTFGLNSDGEVRGYGSTQTSSSLITGINRLDVDNQTSVRGVQPLDEQLSVEVSAFDDDCAAVLLIPAQDSETIPVDEDGSLTVDFGVSLVTFGSPPDPGRGPDQVYEMAPDEPLAATVGQTAEVVVTGRFDGAAITAALDLVLFPCNANSVLNSDVDRFDDENNDGGADGFAETDNGLIMVTAINGTQVSPDTIIGSLRPGSDGAIRITLESSGADCATVTVIDGNGNGKFDITSDGVPTEEYGVAQVVFG